MRINVDAADPAELIGRIDVGPAGPAIGAFFDLDGTLVDGITATAHAGDRIRRRQARPGEVAGVVEAALRYRFGRVHFEALLVRAAGYLTGESLAELDAIGQRIFSQRLRDRVFPDMAALVSAHQRRGHTVVVSSSALTIHAQPVARHLGIDAVLCNHFEVDDSGCLTGRIERPVIWGSTKTAAVQQFCARSAVDLTSSYFYADGEEDIDLMRLVGHPRPVNPRRGPATAAMRELWPTLQVAGPRRRVRGRRAAAS